MPFIPPFTPCSDAAVAACPGLYNDLNSVRGVVHAAVLAAVGDTPCGENLSSSVMLNPVTVGPGNHVMVIPERLTVVRKSRPAVQFQMARLQVRAMVAIVFDGFPIPQMEGDHVLLPEISEYNEAAKFVTSIGWCAFCAMVDAMNAGNLLQSADQFDDVTITDGEFSDSGAGQANITFHLTWTL